MSKELIKRLRWLASMSAYSDYKEATDRIEELERELFNTEADRQLQLELKTTYMRELNEVEAERDALWVDYRRACQTVADMHAAAMGALVGPVRGVVEDIADLKAERDVLQADNARLREAISIFKASPDVPYSVLYDALSATPAQSLARLRNEVLEKAAKKCEPTIWADVIRAMKEPE